ncbi:MAG: Lrp/AsnC family transcriptional regulator [Rhodospirillales bacterium]|jgi:DNA-binding Lrp family transcriptional regulator|nr:Lrp/AsnC family transcriptional regulator [Rhodospirillales bacterium]
MTTFEKRLLDEFQRGFPLVERPFAAIADDLGVTEAEIIETLGRLRDEGMVSRVGAVFDPGAIGASTLAAMAVPPGRLDEVTALVNGFDEVNHNYEREHRINVWFVVTAPHRARLDAVIAEIGERTGLEVLDLPMQEAYHLDLGFPLQWN